MWLDGEVERKVRMDEVVTFRKYIWGGELNYAGHNLLGGGEESGGGER